MINSDFVNLLKKIRFCAERAGLYQKMFICFGTLLGAVRPTMREDMKFYRGLIEYDTDMDIGFLPLKKEEKDRFYQECLNAGIYQWSNPQDKTSRVRPLGELVWFSTRHKGWFAHACCWFFFEWNSYLWHSKGHRWLYDTKFPQKFFPKKEDAQAMMLGAPASYFEKLVEIDFEGVKIHAPLMAGSLCDYWYGDWNEPRTGGTSEKKTVGVIYDWNNKATWRVC